MPLRVDSPLAVELEAVRCRRGREVEVGVEAVGLAEHDIARAATGAVGSALRPTIMSSKPSPFTSPAEATDAPLWSLGPAVDAEAVRAVERETSSVAGKPSTLPNTT